MSPILIPDLHPSRAIHKDDHAEKIDEAACHDKRT
jgi:hypothetical protein